MFVPDSLPGLLSKELQFQPVSPRDQARLRDEMRKQSEREQKIIHLFISSSSQVAFCSNLLCFSSFSQFHTSSQAHPSLQLSVCVCVRASVCPCMYARKSPGKLLSWVKPFYPSGSRDNSAWSTCVQPSTRTYTYMQKGHCMTDTSHSTK